MEKMSDPNQAVATVERRGAMSHAEFMESYAQPWKPVILTDAMSHWKAAQIWSPTYFKTQVGDRRVQIDGASYSVKELFDLIESSTPEDPAPYLRIQKLVEVFPELGDDLEPPIIHAQPNWAESPLMAPSIRRTRLHEILIGGNGASFDGLHYDKDHLHAFIAQFHGEKDFFVYAPGQSPFLYPKDHLPNQARVDIFKPDFESFPEFARAQQIKLTLKPGEVVFMPAGWWHTTRMHGPSISVTWNVVNSTNWENVVADTHDRVEHRANKAVAAAFRAYASAFGRAKALSEGLKTRKTAA